MDDEKDNLNAIDNDDNEICYHCGAHFEEKISFYDENGKLTKNKLCPKCRKHRVMFRVGAFLVACVAFTFITNLFKSQGVLLGALPTIIIAVILIVIANVVTNKMYSQEESTEKYRLAKNTVKKDNSSSCTFNSVSISESVTQGSEMLISLRDEPYHWYDITIFYNGVIVRKNELTCNSSGFVNYSFLVDSAALLGVYDVVIVSDAGKTYKTKFTVKSK